MLFKPVKLAIFGNQSLKNLKAIIVGRLATNTPHPSLVALLGVVVAVLSSQSRKDGTMKTREL